MRRVTEVHKTCGANPHRDNELRLTAGLTIRPRGSTGNNQTRRDSDVHRFDFRR
jgi:hypothetical protein